MDAEKIFHPIDLGTWPMAETFYYYTQIAPTTYTVNVTMDVTRLRRTLKSGGYKFFPAYLYLITRAVCKQQQFRIGVQNGVVGFWDKLTPTYPQFHDDDKTTSLLWTEYDDSFQAFYRSYTEDIKLHGGSHGILTSKGIPLANAFIVSCIPWFSFDSFSLHIHGIKDYYLPSFEAGGFWESKGKTKMPLSITAHHATTEGYHLKLFLEQLRYDMDHVSEWMEV